VGHFCHAGPAPVPSLPTVAIWAPSLGSSHLLASPFSAWPYLLGGFSPKSPCCACMCHHRRQSAAATPPSHRLVPGAPEPTPLACMPPQADWFPRAKLSRHLRCVSRLLPWPLCLCVARAKRPVTIFPCTACPAGPTAAAKSAPFRPPPRSAFTCA
jgi:hypothetical protein